jgi:hypothetical protein
MSSLDASSSDLEVARRISERLAGAAPPAVETPPPPSYVRFGASSRDAAALDAPASFPRPPDLDLRSLDSFGDEHWNEFLEWIARASHADAAFVMDVHGLSIASTGALGPEEIDMMGTRLMIAFEQAARMREGDDHVGAITIEFGEQSLTGITVWIDESLVFTIGVVGKSSPGRALRETISRVVSRSFGSTAT